MEGKQYLYIIRHGDRWDYQNPGWSATAPRPGDPPLSGLGLQQARETGLFLQSLWSADNITSSDITWLSSPFLRCLQTSNAALDEILMHSNDNTAIPIRVESSIFEWDNGTGRFHASLPTDGVQERQYYFPRIDTTYQSLFVPDLPEPRSAFQARCQRAIDAITSSSLHKTKVIVAVTHAAGCIGLASAATGLSYDAITPAGPCSVYRLTRTISSNNDDDDKQTPPQAAWTMDAHNAVDSTNGHTGHLSDMGTKTVPWNNFGDKQYFRGYTGPPTSRFAPEGYVKDEL